MEILSSPHIGENLHEASVFSPEYIRFLFKSDPLGPLKHLTDIKELAATKHDCCIASHAHALAKKLHLETQQRLLPTVIWDMRCSTA